MIKFLIYKHTCTITGMSYIGQTKHSMISRWNRGHLKAAKANSQLDFPTAIREFGKEHWTHEVLEENLLTQKEANTAEMFWIKWYNSKVPNGYNMTIGGSGTNEYHHPIEKRKPMGDYWRNRKRPPEICKKIGDSRRNIPLSLEHRQSLSDANMEFIPTDETRQKMKDSSQHLSPTEHTKTQIKQKNSHPVEKLSLDGLHVIETFKSITDAFNHTNIRHISACCQGKRKHAGGFKWRYVFNDMYTQRKSHANYIIQFDLTGKIIEIFESMKIASQKLNLYYNLIRYDCKNGTSRSRFKWKHMSDV